MVKRRDYPPIRLMGRGEVGEEKREGGEDKVKDSEWRKTNKRLFETALTYVYLAAYLAMLLSIISCYLGEVLQLRARSGAKQANK